MIHKFKIVFKQKDISPISVIAREMYFSNGFFCFGEDIVQVPEHCFNADTIFYISRNIIEDNTNNE